MDHIVSNLISNAFKYGSGAPIEIIVEADGATARLLVRDGGPGIAPEDQARIFHRFERAAASHTSGFGLGLWIVRESARALGGRVKLVSAVGKGSTFTLTLPVVVVSDGRGISIPSMSAFYKKS